MSTDSLPPSLQARFEFLGRLGTGATARVYRVRDRELDREVALKLLADPKDPRRRERFLREAGVLAKLKHENILQVFDYGISPDGPYLATEVLTGPSLKHPAATADPMGAMLGVARGLAAVHRFGLLHRDVKPENMRLRGDGVPVLLDFGLAFDPARTPMTRPGKVVGTYGYLAPEVLGGYSGTPASDWFSFGVSLFWMLEGRMPFSTEEIMQTLAGDPMPVPTFEVLPLDSPVRTLLLQLLDQDPERRPVGLEAVEKVLVPLASASTAMARAVPAGAGIGLASALGRGLRTFLTLGGLAALLAAALVVARRGPPAPGASPEGTPLATRPGAMALADLPATAQLRHAREDLERLLGAGAASLRVAPVRATRIARLTGLFPALTDPLLPPKWRRYVEARVAWHLALKARRPSGLRDPAYPGLRDRLGGALPVRLLEDLDLMHLYALAGGTMSEAVPILTEGPEAGARCQLVLARWSEMGDASRAATAVLQLEPLPASEELIMRGDLHFTDPRSPNLEVLEQLLLRLEAGGDPEEPRLGATATRIFHAARRTESHERFFVCRQVERFGAVWVTVVRRWAKAPYERLRARILAEAFGALYGGLGHCSSYLEGAERDLFGELRYEVERTLAEYPAELAEVLDRHRLDLEMSSLLLPLDPVRREVEAMNLLCNKARRLAGG